MISPDFVFSGAVFFMVGPVAFLIPSYMPLIFPVSDDVWMLWQSCSQYLFAQWRAVCWALFLAALSAVLSLSLGSLLKLMRAERLASVTCSSRVMFASYQSVFFRCFFAVCCECSVV